MLKGIPKILSPELLKVLAFHIVDKQRQNDGAGEVKDQHAQVQHNGVFQDLPEIGVGNKFLKVLQPHKLAAKNSSKGIVVLKGNPQVKHGAILEEDKVQKGKGKEKIKISAFLHFCPCRFLLTRRGIVGMELCLHCCHTVQPPPCVYY